jgi:anti-sigma B factor antagonist
MDFCVNKIFDGKKMTAEVNGALTTDSSPVLLSELESDLANIDELVLDLKNMPYTSSAGVRMILLLLQTMETHGTMKLINVNDDVRELLDTIGFLSLLTVE